MTLGNFVNNKFAAPEISPLEALCLNTPLIH